MWRRSSRCGRLRAVPALRGSSRRRCRCSSVELEGAHDPCAARRRARAASDGAGRRTGRRRDAGRQATSHSRVPSLVIGRIAARQARVEIAPRDTRKAPRRVRHPRSRDDRVSSRRASGLQGVLTNPVPAWRHRDERRVRTLAGGGPGADRRARALRVQEREPRHDQGPWRAFSARPANTAGVLERIAVSGDTDTPEFQLDSGAARCR